ncbi:hypothetical protein [Vibrio vulnificus]|uniref:hypothetical protein n=1 Tax=Vibrio vulnificus TaxID=672 RepID=UPI000CD176EF|nr:hypothetical protein [Vibrio vulnificus]POC39917.1 hypothetical protein CRN38_02375 [Vibrio vulnificus]POC56681.1 hypothetical protein CRN37_14295 [Vibrio vulnificus]POC68214.1 hypothetical protein CRN34_25120 [Vibrio vulnificus]
MSSNVLFVFEGAGAEPNIARNLRKTILDRDNKLVVQTAYGMNIYKLCSEITKDEYFDTYEFIYEQLENRANPTNDDLAVMEIEDPEKISEIYLFFDYDCHCSNADDVKIREMVELFNSAQDKGLLCVSYPMVEAIRHQKGNGVEYLTHKTTDLTNYKKWVNAAPEMDKRFLNWGTYTQETWGSIAKQHLSRANFLLSDVLDLPTSPICMVELFEKQMEKHRPHDQVAVISGFPLMLLDHYGNDTYHVLGLIG